MDLDIHDSLFLKKELKKYTEEILRHVHFESAGKIKGIDIHINENFGLLKNTEDIPRQAFIFYTLCKIHYYDTTYISKKLLVDISEYLQHQYSFNKNIDANSKKFIELYWIRGALFVGFNFNFFLKNLSEKIEIIYSSPLLLNLFLSTESDSLLLYKKSLLPFEYIELAKEAVAYLIYSDQKNNISAFNFVDIFYYNDIMSLDIKKDAKIVVDTKIKKENIRKSYSSGLAKLFEGYCNLKEDMEKINYFYKIVTSRTIRLNPYLEFKYGFNQSSLFEVEHTSYVCVDTYAHLCLGLLLLVKNPAVNTFNAKTP